MKVWLVNYISPSYDDGPVAICASKERAEKWIEYHISVEKRQNYYIVEWDVDE